MKKLLLAVACTTASGALFANSGTTEQRIQTLEMELARLKADLAQQKQQNQSVESVQAQQVSTPQNTAPKDKVIPPSWVNWTDQVKVYGIARLDAAVDFQSSPDSGGRTRVVYIVHLLKVAPEPITHVRMPVLMPVESACILIIPIKQF